MPRLGWDMQTGIVAEWRKQDGEPVVAGEVICLIEGDKGTTELESEAAGVLHVPSSVVGADVPVGEVIAYVLAPGELAADEPRLGEPAAQPAAGGRELSDPTPPEAAQSGAGAFAAESAGQVANGSGPAAAGVEGDLASCSSPRVVASPRARRAAAALGLDWRSLAGSGRGGRVLERDVQRGAAVTRPERPPSSVSDRSVPPHRREALSEADAVRPASPAAEVPAAALAGAAAGNGELNAVRRLTAERMARSARTVAPVTLITEADATALVRLREQALAEAASAQTDARHGASVPSYTDLLVKIAALALREHPALNAEWSENGIVGHEHVNVAIAVDTPRGLLAPVIRDADRRSLHDIGAESRRLIETTRDARIGTADLEGGTFTITNLGMFDIDAFTPIVNLPQCAILGLGRIVPRPVVIDETTLEVGVRRMLSLSLTFDHRVVDGAPAARFLQRIKQLVERPTLWLFR